MKKIALVLVVLLIAGIASAWEWPWSKKAEPTPEPIKIVSTNEPPQPSVLRILTTNGYQLATVTDTEVLFGNPMDTQVVTLKGTNATPEQVIHEMINIINSKDRLIGEYAVIIQNLVRARDQKDRMIQATLQNISRTLDIWKPQPAPVKKESKHDKAN